MPTVLRLNGWRVVVYPNDHAPSHVHVIGPGWIVVVNLSGPTIREVIGCTERDGQRVLAAVEHHQKALKAAWKRYHD